MARNPLIEPIDIWGPISSKRVSRTKCPPHLKKAIRRMWWGDKLNGTCFCCGRRLHYDDAEVGHIKAKASGGKWAPENCRLICRTCNSGMGKTNMKVYMRKYYPDRYKKFFGSDDTKKKTKKPTKTKRKTYDPLEIKIPRIRF